jgi:fumarate reductase subunit C
MHSPHPVTRVPSYPWHMPSGWWLQKKNYVLYMIRELTAVFAALWVVLFLAMLPQLKTNPAVMRSPAWIVFSLIALVFVLYHAFTWFNLMGTVLYFRPGKAPIPGSVIIGTMMVVWIAVSLLIIGILMTAPIGY